MQRLLLHPQRRAHLSGRQIDVRCRQIRTGPVRWPPSVAGARDGVLHPLLQEQRSGGSSGRRPCTRWPRLRIDLGTCPAGRQRRIRSGARAENYRSVGDHRVTWVSRELPLGRRRWARGLTGGERPQGAARGSLSAVVETVAGYPQESWWRLYRANPATALGNVPQVLSLRGPVRSDLLNESLNVLISRHEVLRSCLSQRGDRLWQLI